MENSRGVQLRGRNVLFFRPAPGQPWAGWRFARGLHAASLASSAEEMQGKGSAQVELEGVQDAQLHPDDLLLRVSSVRDVNEILNNWN